jgi:uncharacterized membrane protein
MIDTLLLIVRFAGLLGCSLTAGLFFAFSVAVMGGLARIQPAEGIAAMQAINRVILNRLFLLVFMGTAVVCGFVFLASAWRWSQPGALFFLLGSASYLVGIFLVTIVFNVPMNNALAVVEPSSVDGASLWARYLTDWTAWNHVRTAAGLAATALLAIALYLEGRGAAL